MQKRARGTVPGMVKGRDMLALIVDSFRSADKVDVVYASKRLFDLRFPTKPILKISWTMGWGLSRHWYWRHASWQSTS